jgi:sugar phosphate isomerase/epimerase
MKLVCSRHLWGVTESWENVFPRIADEGYTIIELPIQWLSAEDSARLRHLAEQFGFEILPQCFTEGATVAEHLVSFRQILDKTAVFAPKLINFQSGRDAWSLEQAARFYREARLIESDLGVTVGHETHRGRPFYAPWRTHDILNQVPDLQITVDFSHWVCVAERLVLDEEPDLLRFMADRTVHIHARVGYNEGPQVPDPRAPEYANEVAAHERWWDVVWQHMEARGLPRCTVTPEYGPGRYLHHIPHSDVPVANLWDICSWQMERIRRRFAARSKTASG